MSLKMWFSTFKFSLLAIALFLADSAMSNKMLKNRIVGGKKAFAGQFPWQVSLQMGPLMDGTWQHHCGGSIISKWTVLTAAHCCKGADRRRQLIVAGITNLDKDSRAQKRMTVRSLWRAAFSHDNNQYREDVCLLTVDKPFEFNDMVKPVAFPEKGSEPEDGQKLTVSGWGKTFHEQDIRIKAVLKSLSKLQSTTVKVQNFDECYRKYFEMMLGADPKENNGNQFFGFPPSEYHFCAGATGGGKDSCQGDSGGPYVLKGTNILIGVVSYGHNCAHAKYAGIPAKVSYFIDWIEENKDQVICPPGSAERVPFMCDIDNNCNCYGQPAEEDAAGPMYYD